MKLTQIERGRTAEGRPVAISITALAASRRTRRGSAKGAEFSGCFPFWTGIRIPAFIVARRKKQRGCSLFVFRSLVCFTGVN